MRRLSWIVMGLLLVCLLAQPLALLLISGYQQFISPHKGWHCAYAVLHGGPSCSTCGKEAISRDGVIVGASLLWERFDQCRAAAIALAASSSGKDCDCCGPVRRELERAKEDAARKAKEAAEKAAREAEEAAKKAVDDAFEAAKDAFKNVLDKIPKENCPKCKGPTVPRSEGNRHKWWYCSKCNLDFATYSGNHPWHKDTYKGYCTWYANDRWLYDGNPPVFHGLGDAKNWYGGAPENMRSKVPCPGAVAVFGASGQNPAGHVAYVDLVDQASYTIWHMNAGPGGKVDKGLKTIYFNRVTKQVLPLGATSYSGMPLIGFVHQESGQLSDRIARRRKAMPPIPECLVKQPHGLGENLGAAAIEFAAGKKIDEYLRWWETSVNYHVLAELDLIHAERFAKVGKKEQAEKCIVAFDRHIKQSNLANLTAIDLYMGAAEKTATYAKAVYEMSRAAFVFVSGAAALGPWGTVLADNLYTGIDFVIDYHERGMSQAVKQALLSIVAQQLGEKILNGVGGDAVSKLKGAELNKRLSDIIKECAKDKEFSGRIVASILKATGETVNSDIISSLLSDIQEEIEKSQSSK